MVGCVSGRGMHLLGARLSLPAMLDGRSTLHLHLQSGMLLDSAPALLPRPCNPSATELRSACLLRSDVQSDGWLLCTDGWPAVH
jgi:hypothetical protein